MSSHKLHVAVVSLRPISENREFFVLLGASTTVLFGLEEFSRTIFSVYFLLLHFLMQ